MGGMVMPVISAPGRVRAERRVAAILYVELRNFTRFSDMLEPARVLQLASEFFGFAAQAAESHGGQTLALQNDTLVAAFSAGPPAQLALHAVRAAQHVQRDFGPIGERWQVEYGLPAAVALGLHLGEAVFGVAGPRGAETYVAFGDAVGIAERLVHRARAGEYVLSEAVIKALGAAATGLGAESLPALELARRQPIPIYGVLLDTRLDFT